MRSAIIGQCFGTLPHLAFISGQMLLYLRALHIGSARIIIYLSLPLAVDFLRVPLAYLADRYGKKRIGAAGMVLLIAGFTLISASGFAAGNWAELAVFAGIVIFALGETCMAAGWFALLSPIVPEYLRGRFFGTLRFSWQSTGIVFAAVVAVFLPADAPVQAYQVLMGVFTAALVCRVPFYARVPELEMPRPGSSSFITALETSVRTPHYFPFCCYVFMLSLFTAACPHLFALAEKEVIHLSDRSVVWLGNLLMIGSVLGYLCGGRAVDRFGTKPVFLVCHFVYGVVLFLFLFRAAWPPLLLFLVGACNFTYGFVKAASSVAITTELLALIPQENKSLSASLCQTLNQGGGAFAGFFSAWILEAGILRESWSLSGMSLSAYDALLLACGGMVVLLVMTLGLVPSVLQKSQGMPGNA
ncbi:MAG: hypothetical protein HYU36_18855 [Planctomycetes bacterium]|nr:hypothetical protein [Planctomycetota bacterium]